MRQYIREIYNTCLLGKFKLIACNLLLSIFLVCLCEVSSERLCVYEAV